MNQSMSTLFNQYNVTMCVPINIPGAHFYAFIIETRKHDKTVTFEIRDSLPNEQHHRHYQKMVNNASSWITSCWSSPRCSKTYNIITVPRQHESDCAFHTVSNCLMVCRERIGEPRYKEIQQKMLEANYWPTCFQGNVSRLNFIKDLEENDARVKRFQLHKSSWELLTCT